MEVTKLFILDTSIATESSLC